MRVGGWIWGLLVGLVVWGSLAEAQQNAGLPVVPPEQFAILPWGRTPPDPAALQELRQAGFNLAGFVPPDGLDAVAAAGLKAIVSDPSTNVGDSEAALSEPEIAQRVKALTDRVGGHPAVFGYYLRDEPGPQIFPGLARWSAAFRAAAPSAWPYINLLPNYASDRQLGGDYEQYVERFVTTVNPPFLSYDNYPVMEDGSLRESYFENLEVIRAAALRHNVPFWSIILSNAHYDYAEPTQASLNLQAYAALAYGARGISYYTYFTPPVGNYRLGPIDQLGSKTPTWDLVRRLNLLLLKMAPTYIQLTSVNVFHHPKVPHGAHGLRSSPFLVDLSGGNLLAGEFVGPGGRPAVLVVNKDLRRSTSFGVRFKLAGPVWMVNSYTGRLQPWDGGNVWLAPGQGILLLLGPIN